MLHAQTAARWAVQPDFLHAIRHWTWCRESLPALMQRLAGGDQASSVPPVDASALARAFWSWAAALDNNAPLERLDPVDYAHFQAGMLLAQLLRQRPLRLPGGDRNEEVRVLTDVALTLLSAWRQALGVAPLDPAFHESSAARWSSYVENVAEDPGVAVAFLDLFTGREPVWQVPTMATERPPLRQALEHQRAAG